MPTRKKTRLTAAARLNLERVRHHKSRREVVEAVARGFNVLEGRLVEKVVDELAKRGIIPVSVVEPVLASTPPETGRLATVVTAPIELLAAHCRSCGQIMLGRMPTFEPHEIPSYPGSRCKGDFGPTVVVARIES